MAASMDKNFIALKIIYFVYIKFKYITGVCCSSYEIK